RAAGGRRAQFHRHWRGGERLRQGARPGCARSKRTMASPGALSRFSRAQVRRGRLAPGGVGNDQEGFAGVRRGFCARRIADCQRFSVVMATNSAKASIEGMLKLIKKSKWSLAPVYEGIANALEAIAERQKSTEQKFPGKVEVRFHYTGLFADKRALALIEIADNGMGFDDANFARFEILLDASKGFNNRGSGRVQFLHFAKRIDVESCFLEEGTLKRRRFVCTRGSFITSEQVDDAPEGSKVGATIKLSQFDTRIDGTTQFDALSIDDLASAIKSHFLLRMHLARAVDKATAPSMKVVFFKNDKVEATRKISAADIPKPETGTIEVPRHRIKDPSAEKVEWQRVQGRGEKLQWAHFKLPAAELNENGVFMCSKGIAV